MNTLPSVLRLLPVTSVFKQCDQWVIYLNKKDLYNRLAILKYHNEREYTRLTDIVGIDNLERSNLNDRDKRFDVVYVLLSYRFQSRLRVVVNVDEFESLPSIVRLYPSANWYEREVWDMLGISFKNHPDLRRILTDYGFKGHPMRKDFPLNGYDEVRYDEESKRVVYEDLQLRQHYRRFNFQRPWT